MRLSEKDFLKTVVEGNMPNLGDIKREFKKSGGNRNYIWINCELCDKERWVGLIKNEPRSKICQRCSSVKNGVNNGGANNPRWRGGRIKVNGYIWVWIEKDNFFYSMKGKGSHYVLEHRLVMAKHLGRCLMPFEIIHHKNGIKDDNRIENLELARSSSEHSLSHGKGYQDGYIKGLSDGKSKKIQKLLERIKQLEHQNKRKRLLENRR